jgi:sec-independent protein translocase protein TatC
MATTEEEQRTTASIGLALNGNGGGPLAPVNGALPAAPHPDEEFDDQPMTLVEHLKELRDRLVRMVIGVVVGMGAGFFFTGYVVDYFRAVVKRGDPTARLIITDPTEYIVVYLKITFYLGIGFAMPILIYQFIRFLAPGLSKMERRYVYATLPFVMIFFVAGVLFSSLVAIPNMFKFLLEFGKGKVENDIRIGEVLSFFSNLSLWTGIFFEMPIVMFLLAVLNIVRYETLRRTRRYASVGLMIAAAVITPTPDALSMLIVWAPMYALYELGLILARFAPKRGTSAVETT